VVAMDLKAGADRLRAPYWRSRSRAVDQGIPSTAEATKAAERAGIVSIGG
jgi:hypothetical protein